ncbi:hypothetical protein GJ496_003096 [Pomphorhynchus laevis]|nr:hypothetical protein GJ496_003096 [Pomphorhynchus laevis]
MSIITVQMTTTAIEAQHTTETGQIKVVDNNSSEYFTLLLHKKLNERFCLQLEALTINNVDTVIVKNIDTASCYFKSMSTLLNVGDEVFEWNGRKIKGIKQNELQSLINLACGEIEIGIIKKQIGKSNVALGIKATKESKQHSIEIAKEIVTAKLELDNAVNRKDHSLPKLKNVPTNLCRLKQQSSLESANLKKCKQLLTRPNFIPDLNIDLLNICSKDGFDTNDRVVNYRSASVSTCGEEDSSVLSVACPADILNNKDSNYLLVTSSFSLCEGKLQKFDNQLRSRSICKMTTMKKEEFDMVQKIKLSRVRNKFFKAKNVDRGAIELSLTHDKNAEELRLRVIRGRDLLSSDANGFSDPFVKVYLLPGRDKENKRKTAYMMKTLNPEWNETLVFQNIHSEELKYKSLDITVWDYDKLSSNDFLGNVLIDLSGIIPDHHAFSKAGMALQCDIYSIINLLLIIGYLRRTASLD